jgi:hypothetical protein
LRKNAIKSSSGIGHQVPDRERAGRPDEIVNYLVAGRLRDHGMTAHHQHNGHHNT